MTSDPIDSLRWLAARVEQLTAIDEPDVFELLEYATEILARHTDEPGVFSDGSPVLTHYWLGDTLVSSHLNATPEVVGK